MSLYNTNQLTGTKLVSKFNGKMVSSTERLTVNHCFEYYVHDMFSDRCFIELLIIEILGSY